MADVITYREAVAEGLARELRRDPSVVCLGEDIGAAGGVFKTTAGLFDEFGRERIWDTPISEQAILGAAMGAALTGLRPVAEIMFSDFFACCWDYLANEMPKLRYMTGGQVTVPVVVRTANGGGLGFGAQHSQAVENWALAVPGLKIAAPSTPADVVGLMAAAIRSDDPVVFFEHKGLFASKGPAAPPGHVVELGRAAVVRAGSDVTIVALAATVPLALSAAQRLASEGISAEVIDLRCLVPLDMATVLASVARTSRLLVVEENPYQGGWGATVASIVADEGNGVCGTSVLHITANTEDDWNIGNGRYNNGVAIHLVGGPMGNDGGGPAGNDGGAGFRPDAGRGGQMPAADAASFYETDGGTACTNCHGPTATMGPYRTVSHTPEQTGGFSDTDLQNIIWNGLVPDGGYFDPSVLVPGCDGGATCTAQARNAWHAFHRWTQCFGT